MNDLSAYWDWALHGSGTMSVHLYLKMIEIFVTTGEIAGRGVVWPEDEPWREYSDPLVRYMVRLMSDPQIKAQVLSSRLCGKVFYSSLGRFVVTVKHQETFSRQCQWTERNNAEKVLNWSEGQRTDNWRPLLQEIADKHRDNGFDSEFYRKAMADGGAADDMLWAKMVDDWSAAMGYRRELDVQDYIDKHGEAQQRALSSLMRNAEETMRNSGATDDKAVQAWQQMNGRWDEPEFIKQMRLVKSQDQYPQLGQIVRIMGRVPNSGGTDRLTMATGSSMKMTHSAGSDIDGITTGSDVGTALPIEMAQFLDTDTEDAFLYRYVRGRLQTFRHKSRIATPSRQLSPEHASRKGPMIVCIDTSASMRGAPQRIIKLLLAMIEDMAERQQRDCFLIDFAVSVHAIDLMQRRKQRQYESLGLSKQEYNFEKGHVPFIGGGTDASNMMELTFKLLNAEGKNYVNADVLWVSDFLIGKPADDLMTQMRHCRATGTKFYGLRIVPEGTERTGWEPYFDHISDISYRIMSKW